MAEFFALILYGLLVLIGAGIAALCIFVLLVFAIVGIVGLRRTDARYGGLRGN